MAEGLRHCPGAGVLQRNGYTVRSSQSFHGYPQLCCILLMSLVTRTKISSFLVGIGLAGATYYSTRVDCSKIRITPSCFSARTIDTSWAYMVHVEVQPSNSPVKCTACGEWRSSLAVCRLSYGLLQQTWLLACPTRPHLPCWPRWGETVHSRSSGLIMPNELRMNNDFVPFVTCEPGG
jgi:hypothetical protein